MSEDKSDENKLHESEPNESEPNESEPNESEPKKSLRDNYWFQLFFPPVSGTIAIGLLALVIDPIGGALIRVPVIGSIMERLCDTVNVSCGRAVYLIYDRTADLNRSEDLPEKKKNLEEKRNQYREEVLRDNRNATALTNYGEVLRQFGSLNEAITAQKRALSIDNNLEPALLSLALAQAGLENFEESNQAINRATQQNPQRALNYVCKGEILALQKDRQGYQAALQQAHKLDSTYEPVLKNVCGILNW